MAIKGVAMPSVRVCEAKKKNVDQARLDCPAQAADKIRCFVDIVAGVKVYIVCTDTREVAVAITAPQQKLLVRTEVLVATEIYLI